ncbi:MAG: hypothetical protein WCG26_11570 [Chloroflexales bacterium]
MDQAIDSISLFWRLGRMRYNRRDDIFTGKARPVVCGCIVRNTGDLIERPAQSLDGT